MLGKINLSLLVLLGLLLSTHQANTEIEQSINVLHDQVFFALGPKEEELNRALENNFPEWANYEQNVRWDSEPAKLGEIVREASFQEQFALNPAVTLVTLGESLDWQLPSDSDLFLQSMTIGERLNYLWFEWANPENENIRVQNPEVSNGATYALYVFFDHDKDRLQAWQDTYYRLFGEYPSQPPTSTLLQSSATTVEPFLARPFYNPDNSFFTVNSFFDHQFPRYAGEGDGYKDTLYRFDGISLENAAFNPCTLQVNCYSGHDAIDYNTGENWPIRAAASGTVIDKFQDTGTVLIQHENDLFTVYMHLNTIFVNAEDNVQLGDVIGEAGNKGTGGVHLHFGVRYPDNVEKDIDPFGWWSTDTDPWSEYPTLGQESTWMWKSDEAGDGYLTVDNRESQAQLFLHPESTPPDPPNIGWHRHVSGYQNEAWYTFMNQNTDTYAYWGIWGSTIEQAGEYVVQAYWPGDPDSNDEWLPASNAKYTLYFHDNGVLRKETLYGNQTIGEDQFNPLCKVEHPEGSCPDDQIARFTFDLGATSVILSNPAGYDPTQHQKMLFFDAVRWQQYVPPTPTFTPSATLTPTATIVPGPRGYYPNGIQVTYYNDVALLNIPSINRSTGTPSPRQKYMRKMFHGLILNGIPHLQRPVSTACFGAQVTREPCWFRRMELTRSI
jgi:murein DD-endopeptidase MepM/ murein hydrolase activator NlpD